VKVHVKKWGNSASIRIPSSVMLAASLSLDQAVEVTEEDGRIVIVPIKAQVYDLDDMVANMKPETFHDDVNFGIPIGEEIW
jgi:antitoxin MazE